jgi:hypothetical protein
MKEGKMENNMELGEKVAFIKGLIEGLGIDESTKEGKVILAIVDVLDDVALSVSDLEDSVDLLGEQFETLDEDVEELYGELFGDEDDDDDDDFDGELYEVECPSCGEIICLDEDMLDEGEIECPNCGEPLEFDLDGAIAEECDCGEDHGEKE